MTPARSAGGTFGSFRQGQKTARTLSKRPGGTVRTAQILPLPAGGSVKMLWTLPLGAGDSVGTLRTLPLPAGDSVKTLRTLPPGAGGSVKTGLKASAPAPKPPDRPNRSPGFVPSRYGGKTRNELRGRSTSVRIAIQARGCMTPAKMESGVKLPSHCSIPPATSSMSMPPMPPHMPRTRRPSRRLDSEKRRTPP